MELDENNKGTMILECPGCGSTKLSDIGDDNIQCTECNTTMSKQELHDSNKERVDKEIEDTLMKEFKKAGLNVKRKK